MTEFEYLAIPISLILGLGIAKILGATTNAIRNRAQTRIHWFPLAWAFLIFLFHVEYFFVVWDIDKMGEPWTWDRFGPPFFTSILFYLSAGLILPSGRRTSADSLLTDFNENGRLALIPLAVMLIVSIPISVLLGDVPLLYVGNFVSVVLIALMAVVWFANRQIFRIFATVIFGLVLPYAMLFVWSRPGD